MKNKACLYYLYLENLARNKKDEIATISNELGSILNSNLFSNSIEQINKIENIEKIIITQSDSNPLINESISAKIKSVDCPLEKDVLDKLEELQSDEYGRNLILFSNTIGYSSNDIKRVFDLLLAEGEVLVIGKTKNDRICFLGTNFLDSKLLKNLADSKFQFDNLLKRINRENVNYFVLNGFLKIRNLNDFKDLYSLLSSRKSENFCSEKSHENFTNLFIEYKDYLQ